MSVAVNGFASKFDLCEKAKMALDLCPDAWNVIAAYLSPSDRAMLAVSCRQLTTNNKKRTLRTVNVAARQGQLSIVKWCKKNKYQLGEKTFSAAASSGNLKLVKWLERKHCLRHVQTASRKAAKYGHLKVLKWCNRRQLSWSQTAVNTAAKHGHLKTVKWCFWSRGSSICFQEVVGLAAQNRHWQIFRWCVKQGCFIDNAALSAVLLSGNEKAFQLCVKTTYKRLPPLAAICAVRGGNLRVVQACYEMGAELREDTLYYAACEGNLEIFAWLVEQGLLVTTPVLDAARCSGHANILEYCANL